VEIIFTAHAKVRIRQRNISEDEVKSAIANPDGACESFKDRTAVRKKSSQGTLEVIYKTSGTKIIIITCYWLKEG
jgi:hypothetical protein